MGKIYVKCKDKSSQRWIGAQNISIVGNIPKQVDQTGEVTKLLKAGVLMPSTVEEYERYHKKTKASKSEKLKLSTDLLIGAIDAGEIKAASKYLEQCKGHGMKADAVKKYAEAIIIKEDKVNQAAELSERIEKATIAVEIAIENDVLKTDEKGNICLGEKRIATEVDQVINWASLKDENIKEIEDAIEAADKEDEK